jgi:hypothetical protein
MNQLRFCMVIFYQKKIRGNIIFIYLLKEKRENTIRPKIQFDIWLKFIHKKKYLKIENSKNLSNTSRILIKTRRTKNVRPTWIKQLAGEKNGNQPTILCHTSAE